MVKKRKITSLLSVILAVCILLSPIQAFAFSPSSSVDEISIPQTVRDYVDTIYTVNKQSDLHKLNCIVFYSLKEDSYYLISYPADLYNPDINIYYDIDSNEAITFKYSFDTFVEVFNIHLDGTIDSGKWQCYSNKLRDKWSTLDKKILFVYWGDGKDQNKLVYDDSYGNINVFDLSHIKYKFDRSTGIIYENGKNPNPDPNPDPELPPAYDDTQLNNNINSGFAGLGNKITEFKNKVSSWFTDLKNSIVNLRDSISTYFNNLGDKISGFFSELKLSIQTNLMDLRDNIQHWLRELQSDMEYFKNNVNTHFNELKNNIKDYFNDIKVNIDTKIQDIKDWFSNLFNVSEGYFDTYKEKWDLWCKEHLGFLYEAGQLGSSMIQQLFGFVDTPPATFLHIPELKLPFSKDGVDHVILQAQDVNLDEIFKAGILKTIFTMYQTAVTATFYYLLYNLARRKFDEFLAEREL